MHQVVSFSGGRTSAYLVHLMEAQRKAGASVHFIFMDTGCEHPLTYRFIREVVKFWNVPLTVLQVDINPELGQPNGYTEWEPKDIQTRMPVLKPFMDMVKKYGIPVYADSPAPVVPDEIDVNDVPRAVTYFKTHRDCYADGWNACRAAMLQSGNFRENKNSSTNNFREIAETSTNYPVIPSEVLSAIREVAKIRADFDDFDGDRRGIGDCLDEAEQELIVTINKYASQLAAEPIAPNDVREQTAIPQVPVTPDGWISCSERMPNTKTAVLVAVEFDRKGDWRMKWATYIPGHPDANDGWIIPGASWKPSHWMPLPEPPQEVNQ
ncbi:TPA: DUF551 domain-containing protein [Escherichia coli]|nr:DUF551 domain-containing protein [Escherichia coli]